MMTSPEVPANQGEVQPANVELYIPQETRLGLGRFAVEQITLRNEYSGRLSETHAKLAELDALRAGGTVDRLKQRGALKSWLKRHDFPNHTFARNILTERRDILHQQHEEQSSLVEAELKNIRELFGTFNDIEKEYADLYMRHCGLPGDIVSACDATADKDSNKRNLISWLMTPEEENIKENASSEQLEAVLNWNALHTESIAADTELIPSMVKRYVEGVRRCVSEGKLDPAFASAPLVVDKIIVGDILDRRFLGYGGQTRMGEYARNKRELYIWPYDLPGETPTKEVVNHELTHTKGGFEGWIDEAYTERFNLIIQGLSPDQQSNTYPHDRTSIRALQDGAPEGMSDRRASVYYAGPDPKTNEQQLREDYKRAYKGVDTLGIVNEAFKHFTDSYTSDGLPVPAESRNNALRAVLLSSLHISHYSQQLFKSPQLAPYIEKMFQESAHDEHDEVEAVAFRVAANFCAHVSRELNTS